MNKKKRAVPGVHPYDGPAGGWGALKATAIAVRTQMDALDAPVTLLRTNQPDGFDCPGCAWPDKEHKSTFQFCENGAKAVTWEATSKRVTPEFLAANTVTSLLAKSDFELEGYGRITHPLSYDRESDTLRPVSWESAFARIGEVLQGMQPDEVEFYTSGRASNEAAYLFQLYAREFGTNNFRTALICATRQPASVCRNRSASAKARCLWTTLIKPNWLFPSVTTPEPTIRA